jgi:hypothetical protein
VSASQGKNKIATLSVAKKNKRSMLTRFSFFKNPKNQQNGKRAYTNGLWKKPGIITG